MKNVRMILVLVLLSFGANYVLASSTWRNPTAEPPGGNADAPINVSAVDQAKIGSLEIGVMDDGVVSTLASEGLGIFGSSFFGGQVQIEGGPLQIQDGTEAPGFVLSSDDEGVASWVDVNTLVGWGTETTGDTGLPQGAGYVVILQEPIDLPPLPGYQWPTPNGIVDISDYLPAGISADSAIVRGFTLSYSSRLVYIDVAHPDSTRFDRLVYSYADGTTYNGPNQSPNTDSDTNDGYVKLKNNQFKVKSSGQSPIPRFTSPMVTNPSLKLIGYTVPVN